MHNLGQNMNHVWPLTLFWPFIDPRSLTWLTPYLLIIAKLLFWRFLEVRRLNMWFISLNGVFIGPSDGTRCQSEPLTRFSLGRFFFSEILSEDVKLMLNKVLKFRVDICCRFLAIEKIRRGVKCNPQALRGLMALNFWGLSIFMHVGVWCVS